MIEALIIPLVVFCACCVIVYLVTSLPGVPAIIRTIAYIVLCLIAVIWLLEFVSGSGLTFGHRC